MTKDDYIICVAATLCIPC